MKNLPTEYEKRVKEKQTHSMLCMSPFNRLRTHSLQGKIQSRACRETFRRLCNMVYSMRGPQGQTIYTIAVGNDRVFVCGYPSLQCYECTSHNANLRRLRVVACVSYGHITMCPYNGKKFILQPNHTPRKNLQMKPLLRFYQIFLIAVCSQAFAQEQTTGKWIIESWHSIKQI